MLKVILIDPARQQISETRIQPNQNAIFQLIGCPPHVLVWIGYETRVAFSKDPPQEGAFFCLPGSPQLFSRGVIFGCLHDGGTLCDVPLPIAEARRMVEWGRTRAEVSATLRRGQEAQRGL